MNEWILDTACWNGCYPLLRMLTLKSVSFLWLPSLGVKYRTLGWRQSSLMVFIFHPIFFFSPGGGVLKDKLRHTDIFKHLFESKSESVNHSVASSSFWPHGQSLSGSSVHGILQTKNTRVGCHDLPQGIFPTRDQTWVSHVAGRFFTVWAIREMFIWVNVSSYWQ